MSIKHPDLRMLLEANVFNELKHLAIVDEDPEVYTDYARGFIEGKLEAFTIMLCLMTEEKVAAAQQRIYLRGLNDRYSKYDEAIGVAYI